MQLYATLAGWASMRFETSRARYAQVNLPFLGARLLSVDNQCTSHYSCLPLCVARFRTFDSLLIAIAPQGLSFSRVSSLSWPNRQIFLIPTCANLDSHSLPFQKVSNVSTRYPSSPPPPPIFKHTNRGSPRTTARAFKPARPAPICDPVDRCSEKNTREAQLTQSPRTRKRKLHQRLEFPSQD
jgi:hypothetical protein